jgi:AcrR family transcriptional regulator
VPSTRIRRSDTPGVPARLQARKQPSQARAQALVAAIHEAGSRILVERGYEGLAMQRVAEVAGVSPGSLYQYYPTKDALVAALAVAQSERELAFHQASFAAIPPDAPLEVALRALLRSTLAFQAQEGPLMRRLLDAMIHIGRFEALIAKAELAAAFLHALLSAHAARLAVDDLALATHVVANAIHSLTHDGVLRRPDALSDEVLLEHIERLVLGYLLPPGRAQPGA